MTTTRHDPFAAWKQALADSIDATVRYCRKKGTVGMSRDCLLANTRPPSGGPGGTNARYYYNQTGGFFDEALAMSKLGTRFVR